MGRRSVHTAEELRELILQASTELIEQHGLGGLSAREIARRIDYSPGTLYNVFHNLDDLVLTIEGRLLDRLAARLDEVAERVSNPRERLLKLAATYLEFTHQSPKLWNLLFEHRLPSGQEIPGWYQQKLESLMTRVEEALAAIMVDGDAGAIKRAARVLWAGVHGITSLSTAEKLSAVSSERASALVDDLVRTYLSGLEHRRK
jgi:AcrR family transcriptional regulator